MECTHCGVSFSLEKEEVLPCATTSVTQVNLEGVLLREIIRTEKDKDKCYMVLYVESKKKKEKKKVRPVETAQKSGCQELGWAWGRGNRERLVKGFEF